MADADRGSPLGLTARLSARGHEYEFYQAVALLEMLAAKRADAREAAGDHPIRRPIPLGEGADPGQEALRLTAPASLKFAPTDVQRISDPGGPVARVESRVMGLTGTGSPLPDWVTEVMALRAPRQDTALRDFLDIFNHRLLSLLYRVRAKARVGFGFTRPDRSSAAEYLFSLMGLGTARVRDRMPIPDRLLLSYVGLLSGRTRSVGALEKLLSHALAVPVRVQPLTGRWLTLPSHERTRLGRMGGNNRLGGGAMVGHRVWDVESCFTLVVGPMGWRDMDDFLPGAPRHGLLVALTRFFVGDTQDFVIRLKVRRAEIPALTISARNGARLGWTSVLRAANQTQASGDVQIRPRL